MTNSSNMVIVSILTAMTILSSAEAIAQQQDTVNLATDQVELFAGPTNNVELEGQVINNSSAGVRDVRVHVEFYDPNGQLILEESRFITQPSQVLQAGESIPFAILETFGFDQVGEHEVYVEARPVTNGA